MTSTTSKNEWSLNVNKSASSVFQGFTGNSLGLCGSLQFLLEAS